MRKLTQKDPNQIVTAEHDDTLGAKRVVLVGGDLSDVGQTIKDSLSNALKDIKIEVSSQKEQQVVTNIQTVEVPVIIKEVQIVEVERVQLVTVREVQVIEVPVIVKEIERIEVPTIITKTETVVIEKPVIIEKIINSDTKYLKYILIVQLISLLLIGLTKFIK